MNNLNCKSVLIVGKSEEIRSKLVVLLSQLDMTVIVTSNGYNAIKICRQNENIDLVFMEIQLNGITGFEVLYEIKKIRKEIKSIAVVTNKLKGKSALNLGFDELVVMSDK